MPGLAGQLAELIFGRVGGHLLAERERHRLVHADRGPVPADVVLGSVRPPHDRAAQPFPRGAQDQVPSQAADRGVVAVRLVRLQHRELGIVRRVRALVAEVPAELVDLLQAADHQPLQVELERDPQVHRHVVGVDVGDERPGVGPAVQGLQHRGLGLDEPLVVQFLADGPGDRGPELGQPPASGLTIRST